MTIPTRFPVSTLLGLLLGLGLAFGTFWGWQTWVASPAQAFYLRAYVRSAVAWPKVQVFRTTNGQRSWLGKYPAHTMHAWLGAAVYENGKVLKGSAIIAGSGLFVCLAAGAIMDGRRRAALIRGVQVAGRQIKRPEQLQGGRDPFLIRVETFELKQGEL